MSPPSASSVDCCFISPTNLPQIQENREKYATNFMIIILITKQPFKCEWERKGVAQTHVNRKIRSALLCNLKLTSVLSKTFVLWLLHILFQAITPQKLGKWCIPKSYVFKVIVFYLHNKSTVQQRSKWKLLKLKTVKRFSLWQSVMCWNLSYPYFAI